MVTFLFSLGQWLLNLLKQMLVLTPRVSNSVVQGCDPPKFAFFLTSSQVMLMLILLVLNHILRITALDSKKTAFSNSVLG